MKVLVEVPVELFRALEKRCDAKHEFFKLITSAVVTPDKDLVTIRCESERGMSFVAWANEVDPRSYQQITITSDQ